MTGVFVCLSVCVCQIMRFLPSGTSRSIFETKFIAPYHSKPPLAITSKKIGWVLGKHGEKRIFSTNTQLYLLNDRR